MSFFLGFLLCVAAIFLILLVLVQRGRGGGLAGALGGMGGSSAFGAKAGDVFTRITIVTAAVWIVLCVASVKMLSQTDPADVRTNVTTPAPPSGALTSPAQEQQGSATGAEIPPENPAPPESDE